MQAEIAGRQRVISIGECMVELSRGADGRFGLAYGGDTFNTAVYLARAGVPVAYATALGDDPYSSSIIAAARAEGVAGDLMTTLPGRMPGLYLIETDREGERAFWYWRDRAAARELFECPAADTVATAMRAASLIYFSGVTLSLYSASGLDVLAHALTAARASGANIAMDGNYRPRGWANDQIRARATLQRFWSLSTIALPAFDDEHVLWGDADPRATVDRLAALGIGEIVVKQGADGAWLSTNGAPRHLPCPSVVRPVDTTAAGDSFNAGYLAQRLAGAAPQDAVLQGHRLASVVIQHHGAIVPAAATAAILGASSAAPQTAHEIG